MLNPILVPVRNNLHLTRKAIKTFEAQDIAGGVYILVIDNASTDGTAQFLQTKRNLATMHFNPPLSVAESWNRGLEFVFRAGAEYAMVVNNDVELRPDTMRRLVDDGGGFVTAVGTRDPNKIEPMVAYELPRGGNYKEGQTVLIGEPLKISAESAYPAPDPAMKRPHPDFSCYLIRRSVWETVGPFDENFKIAFSEDLDMHVRLHKAGIKAYCIDLPFLHHGSMTIKNAEPAEVRKIQIQAEKNRAYFKKKWGM